MVNPPARLVFAGLGFGLIAFGMVMAVACFGTLPGLGLAIALVIWITVFLVMRGPLFSMCISLVGSKYINWVRIDAASVSFGFNGLVGTIPRRSFRVTRGLLGTFGLRHPYYFIVIPKEAITLDELKRLIEAEDWQASGRSCDNPPIAAPAEDFNTKGQ